MWISWTPGLQSIAHISTNKHDSSLPVFQQQSEMAPMWAQWLPSPCLLGGSQCSARGQNQKWPPCGHSGYLTPAVSGSPMLCTGTKPELAHMWAQWLPNPCCLRGPQCSARGQNQKWPTCGNNGYLTLAISRVPNALHGDKIRNGRHVSTPVTQPLPSRGPQCLARGQNQKWPPCGHSGYLTPTVSGVPNALHGDKIRNGPHVGNF